MHELGNPAVNYQYDEHFHDLYRQDGVAYRVDDDSWERDSCIGALQEDRFKFNEVYVRPPIESDISHYEKNAVMKRDPVYDRVLVPYINTVLSSAYGKLFDDRDDLFEREIRLDFARWGWGINVIKLSLARGLWETLRYPFAVKGALDNGYTGTLALVMGHYYTLNKEGGYPFFSGQYQYSPGGIYNVSLIEAQMELAAQATDETWFCGTGTATSLGRIGDMGGHAFYVEKGGMTYLVGSTCVDMLDSPKASVNNTTADDDDRDEFHHGDSGW